MQSAQRLCNSFDVLGGRGGREDAAHRHVQGEYQEEDLQVLQGRSISH